MTGFVNEKISCVVPVYNEGKRVSGVLNALVGHHLIDEVIVVNDGSTDDSERVLRGWSGIKLISYKPNKGKSHAMMTGIKEARNDLILTIDSDLVGLTREDVMALIEPVVSGKADVSMTLRKNSLAIFKYFGLDFVSGERVFDRRTIPDLHELGKLTCFGLESYLNNLIIKNKARLKVVYWKNVITPRKAVKFGYREGTKRDWKMVMEIVKYLGVKGVYRQFRAMLKLKV
ncbi:glycosyltransferase family 2 protein [Candidatus Peregrinibacteria bacterium]|nr:glycosyltransferase family 2 protein [Candidatus Peregrinibacteria bacterium]